MTKLIRSKPEIMNSIREQVEALTDPVGLIWYYDTDDKQILKYGVERDDVDVEALASELGVNPDSRYSVEWISDLDAKTPLFPIGAKVTEIVEESK